MAWIVISGSWREINHGIECDVRKAVAGIIKRGDGIVTGGALGVDSLAAEEALTHNPDADRIRIIIPTRLAQYAAHYRNRAREGAITHDQAEKLIGLLTAIAQRRTLSLHEMDHCVVNQESYYDRNTQLLEGASELLAFQVNNSAGTQDTINKARKLGLTVTVKHYHIAN